MNQESQPPVADNGCPITFVVLPTFVGALVWLWVMLNVVGP